MIACEEPVDSFFPSMCRTLDTSLVKLVPHRSRNLFGWPLIFVPFSNLSFPKIIQENYCALSALVMDFCSLIMDQLCRTNSKRKVLSNSGSSAFTLTCRPLPWTDNNAHYKVLKSSCQIAYPCYNVMPSLVCKFVRQRAPEFKTNLLLLFRYQYRRWTKMSKYR